MVAIVPILKQRKKNPANAGLKEVANFPEKRANIFVITS